MSEEMSHFSDMNEMQNSLLNALRKSNEVTSPFTEQFLSVFHFRFSLEIKQLCFSAFRLQTWSLVHTHKNP